MGKMYESFKEVVHEMSRRNKSDQIHLAAAGPNYVPSVMPEVDQTDQTVAERFDGLKVALQQTQEMVENESQRVVQVIIAQKEKLEKLETQLADAGEKFRRKESASDAMEKSLNAKIDTLQEELREKVETLQSRENQINDLKLNLDTMSTHIRESESNIRQVLEEAAAEHKRTEELKESLNQKIAIVETEKQTLLAAREREVSDLKSQLQLLTSWVKEMPSFVKQPETTLAAVVEPQNSGDTLNDTNEVVEKPTVDKQIVPQVFFDLISQELVSVKGALSSTIVRDHVAAIGESLETFPRSKLPMLLDHLSEGIVNRNARVAFRKSFLRHAQVVVIS